MNRLAYTMDVIVGEVQLRKQKFDFLVYYFKHSYNYPIRSCSIGFYYLVLWIFELIELIALLELEISFSNFEKIQNDELMMENCELKMKDIKRHVPPPESEHSSFPYLLRKLSLDLLKEKYFDSNGSFLRVHRQFEQSSSTSGEHWN